MKIAVALREVHDAEIELAEQLLRTGERHRSDHDVFHLSRTLSGWCARNLDRVAEQARRYDLDLDAEVDEGDGPVAKAREKAAELAGRRPEAGLLLLRDLRELHLAAARASLAWTVLGQGAQAVQDPELLGVVTASHPETIRIMKWTVQKLKEASPQVLSS